MDITQDPPAGVKTVGRPGARALTSQLADDLGWLEGHLLQHEPQLGQQPEQAVLLRLAAALIRNCIGPFLDGQPPTPLHIAVVGGAGAGKSTVANLLSGTRAAEANPQAGFTRHPIAYTSANGALSWASHLGFLGPLQRLDQPRPADLDEDVYQVRRVAVDGSRFSLLQNFVVWDCPDMNARAAKDRIRRLLEVAALADVIVYVASDERYNDEVPTRFLDLLLQAGKPVVVCLTKMQETDASTLVTFFRRQVLSRLPAGVVAVLTIPFFEPEQLADPIHLPDRCRVPLLNQIALLGQLPSAARRRTVQWGSHFLAGAQERLLSAIQSDLAALQAWREAVQAGHVEFDNRYRNEYLAGEKFHRFDGATVQLLDLLELPNAGQVVSRTLWVLRTPYRLIKVLVNKGLRRPPSAVLPERSVLESALSAWLDLLRKEVARRARTHPLWAHIDKGFNTDLADLTHGRFEQSFRAFQQGPADEVDRTARALYEGLKKNPVLLNTLRGSKLAVDVAAVAGALAIGGLAHWPWDFVLVPVFASVTTIFVELLSKLYVDGLRERARKRQQALVTQYVSGPLAEWLAQWPETGGSAYERLQLVVRRIPAGVQQLNALVKQAIA